MSDDSPLTATFEPALLNGVEEIRGSALQLSCDDHDQLLKTSREVRAIPYFAWANRGRSEMIGLDSRFRNPPASNPTPQLHQPARSRPHPAAKIRRQSTILPFPPPPTIQKTLFSTGGLTKARRRGWNTPLPAKRLFRRLPFIGSTTRARRSAHPRLLAHPLS